MSNRKKRPDQGKSGFSKSDPGSSKSTMYGSFNILNMTPEEITKRYEHAIREHEKYLNKKRTLNDAHERSTDNRSTSSSTSSTHTSTPTGGSLGNLTTISSLKSDLVSSFSTSYRTSASEALKSGAGVASSLQAGLKGAVSGLGSFVKGLDPATIALSFLTEGAIKAGQALIRSAEESWEFNNKMIQQYTISYGISNEFLNRGRGSVRDANAYLGVNVLRNEDLYRAGESILPTFRDQGIDVASSYTDTVMVGQAMGVSYNEQVLRMYREQYKQSGELGDAQLSRLERLAELSEVTNLSLDELVQITAGETRDINQFANMLIQSYVESGEMTTEQAIATAENYREMTTALQAYAQSELGLSESDASTIALTVGEVMTASADNIAELSRKYAGLDVLGLQESVLGSVESGDLTRFMRESMNLVQYGQSTSTPLWGTGNMWNYLSMAGLGNQALTDAAMSATPGYGLSNLEEWLEKYDSATSDEIKALTDKSEDIHVSMVDNITQGINQSSIGVWATNQVSGIGHRVSSGVNKVVNEGFQILRGMFTRDTSSWTPSSTSLSIGRAFGINSPEGGGIGGIGGGYGPNATPSTGPSGVDPWTMTAGYRDPNYLRLGYGEHKGIDYAAPSGTPIPSTTEGTVTFAGWNSGGFGNLAVVKDSQGLDHYYAHMVGSPRVKKGQRVSPGTILGGVGTTGRSTGNHLHYQVNRDGKHINPVPWVSRLWGGTLSSATSEDVSGAYEGSMDSMNYVYRSSLANLVQRVDNSHLYNAIGGETIGRSIANSLPSIQGDGNSEELLNVLVGLVGNIQNYMGYNSTYNGNISRR